MLQAKAINLKLLLLNYCDVYRLTRLMLCLNFAVLADSQPIAQESLYNTCFIKVSCDVFHFVNIYFSVIFTHFLLSFTLRHVVRAVYLYCDVQAAHARDVTILLL